MNVCALVDEIIHYMTQNMWRIWMLLIIIFYDEAYLSEQSKNYFELKIKSG
jgi:hypothetical protein